METTTGEPVKEMVESISPESALFALRVIDRNATTLEPYTDGKLSDVLVIDCLGNKQATTLSVDVDWGDRTSVTVAELEGVPHPTLDDLYVDAPKKSEPDRHAGFYEALEELKREPVMVTSLRGDPIKRDRLATLFRAIADVVE